MTERTPIQTPDAPAAIGPYSQAIRAGDVLYCSGQIPLDPATGELTGGDDVRAQTRRVMDNLGAVLKAGGSGFDRVLKTTILLADIADFATVNEVYGSYFDGMTPPARATFQVAALPKGARVEIDAVALAG
ncbi:MAG TPA: RidA family protein [Polyangiaceae bacterium LLY-WYZ-14_1]|nr:RidA family protein [Polyangiaceae bacterium LLY-WYZ-14_1]